MTAYTIVFHESVSEDYNEAYSWYESQQAGLGNRFLAAVRVTARQIAHAPETYGEKAKKGYREASLKNFPFALVYKIYEKKKTILVVSIHHHKKHPRKKYRR